MQEGISMFFDNFTLLNAVLGVLVAGASLLFVRFVLLSGNKNPVPALGVVAGQRPRLQPAKVKSGWQVRFAGEWHECSPPLGYNSPGWVRVRLTDSRTHSRVIIRQPDEIRQV